jgi:tetratricopeptide (TPR) repeat protein
MQTAENMERSTQLYDRGKACLERGEVLRALKLLDASSKLFPHFKTLELQGQCYFKLKRYSEAIIFLAAATSLNRGLRAPLLLMDVLLEVPDVKAAKDIAKIVLAREPNHKQAKALLKLE